MSTLTRINWIARAGLAFMFGYHGLVPKLLWLSPGERTMILAHGIEQVELFATLAGVGEIALALWLLLAPRSPWPLLLAATSRVILLLDVALLNPTMLRDAFNPVSLNIAGLALCAIAWHTRPTSSVRATATGSSSSP